MTNECLPPADNRIDKGGHVKTAIRSFPRQVVLCAAVVVAASCGRTSPVSPAPSSRATGHQGLAASTGEGVAFPLIAGSFVISTAKGHEIVGAYSGTAAIFGAAVQSSTLTLQISGGSGTFADAAGTIAIQGNGAFADEGEFVLEGRGDLILAGGRSRGLVLSLRGVSRATCASSGRIAITQTAGGTMAHAGRVTATLRHEVGSTSCDSQSLEGPE